MVSQKQFLAEKKPIVGMRKEQIAAFNLDFNALTMQEKHVLSILREAEEPLTPYMIYEFIVWHTHFEIKAKQKKKIARPSAEDFIEFVVLMSSGGIIKYAQKLNREHIAQIPSYKSVQTILSDFCLIGWAAIRKKGKKKLYYMPSEIKEKFVV